MTKNALIVFIACCFAIISCEKIVDDPTQNPFAVNADQSQVGDSVNPYSIQGLHKNIFSVKCANPTCHDGTFEPDFRTIQSSYNSLVYQPVIKNNAQNEFLYRVVPGKIVESWLHERLVTGDPILGRMPLYAPPLTNEELFWITGWIGNGARDLNNNVASFPNLPPTIRYYYATDSGNNRIDTNRVSGWSSPFIIQNGSTCILHFWVEDDSTATQNLGVNQLKVSSDPDDFSNAVVINATFLSGKIWIASVQANQFASNTQLYFRYYVEDPEQSGLTEYPRNELPYYYKENASFIIQ